jgi:hypothetical protein
MKPNSSTKRLFRIELAIALMAVVAMVAMSGTAAAAANSASVEASPNPVIVGGYTTVTGEIDLQALFWCGGYTLETHVSQELKKPSVLSTNAAGGSITVGYSDALNERAWRWDSGFGAYCASPTKYVKLATTPDRIGFFEVAAGSDYFYPEKWEQGRVYSYYFWYN